MHGPHGAAWYLGEHVSIKSLRSTGILTPKSPPISMLMKDRVHIESEELMEDGQSAYNFVVYNKNIGKHDSGSNFSSTASINYL